MNKTTKRSIFLRGLYLALLMACACSILAPSFVHLRRTHQVKETMLQIQHALQDYHVKQEAYPARYPMSGAELVRVLMDSGHLKVVPRNPYTGRPYALDGRETDRIVYTSSESLKTYSLEALGFGDEAVFLVLDSGENPSFEMPDLKAPATDRTSSPAR